MFRIHARRLPTLLQRESGECGLACLAMLARYHGADVELAALRRRFDRFAGGASLATVLAVAAEMGFIARALRVELVELARLRLPCVVHWDLAHFVVLEAVDRRGAVVRDPARGARRVDRAELSRRFTGIAVELAPTPALARTADARRPRPRLADLAGDVRGLGPALLQVACIGVATETLALASPLLIQWVVDHAIPAGDREMLTLLGVGFLLLATVQASLAAARGWAALRLGADFGLQWHSNLVRQLLQLPLAFFERRSPHELVARLGSAHAIQHTLTGSTVESVVDGLFAALAAAAMLAYSPRLALVSTAAVAAYAALRALAAGRLRQRHAGQLVATGLQQSLLAETLAALRVVRAAGAVSTALRRWRDAAASAVDHAEAAQRIALALRTAHALLAGVEYVVVVWMAAGLVIDAHLTVGMMFAFLAYRAVFAARVVALIDRVGDLAVVRAHADRLFDIVDASRQAPPPADARGPSSAPQPATGHRPATDREPFVLRCTGVTVPGAPGARPRLDAVSLELRPGEILALTGPSGAGKSTLVEVLLGLVVPVAGTVQVNCGTARAAPSGAALSGAAVPPVEGLAFVLQDDRLLTGTIVENVTGFDAMPDELQVVDALRAADVEREVRALPMGLETQVSPFGFPLSVGQRQRLLIARALYRGPRVLVLDEATGALDADSERRILDALRQRDIAAIIVTHRAESSAAADRTVRIEHGRVTRQAAGGADAASRC